MWWPGYFTKGSPDFINSRGRAISGPIQADALNQAQGIGECGRGLKLRSWARITHTINQILVYLSIFIIQCFNVSPSSLSGTMSESLTLIIRSLLLKPKCHIPSADGLSPTSGISSAFSLARVLVFSLSIRRPCGSYLVDRIVFRRCIGWSRWRLVLCFWCGRRCGSCC